MKRYSFEDYCGEVSEIIDIIKDEYFKKNVDTFEYDQIIENESMKIFILICIDLLIGSQGIYNEENQLVNVELYFDKLKSHVKNLLIRIV